MFVICCIRAAAPGKREGTTWVCIDPLPEAQVLLLSYFSVHASLSAQLPLASVRERPESAEILYRKRKFCSSHTFLCMHLCPRSCPWQAWGNDLSLHRSSTGSASLPPLILFCACIFVRAAAPGKREGTTWVCRDLYGSGRPQAETRGGSACGYRNTKGGVTYRFTPTINTLPIWARQYKPVFKIPTEHLAHWPWCPSRTLSKWAGRYETQIVLHSQQELIISEALLHRTMESKVGWACCAAWATNNVRLLISVISTWNWTCVSKAELWAYCLARATYNIRLSRSATCMDQKFGPW